MRNRIPLIIHIPKSNRLPQVWPGKNHNRLSEHRQSDGNREVCSIGTTGGGRDGSHMKTEVLVLSCVGMNGCRGI